MKEKNECMKKGFQGRYIHINTFFEIVKTKKEDGIRNDVEAKTFPRFPLLNKQAQPRSEPKALFGWRSIHSFSPFPNYNKFQAHET